MEVLQVCPSDSKYCERHMHRGCNRSRKPVESHTISHPPLSVNSLAPTSGSGTSPHNFQNIPFGSPMTDSQGSNTPQLQMDPTPYGLGNKDYRQQQWKESKAASKQRLDQCKDIIIGDELQRGIWGGKKKRVTTGRENEKSQVLVNNRFMGKWSFFQHPL